MKTRAYDAVRSIMEKCAGKTGCDVCRLHMEEDCLFFPELYRMADRLEETGDPIRPRALKHLLDLCTGCGLCPCPDIRELIIQAKAAWFRDCGTPMGDRIISNVETLVRLGTTIPGAVNRLGRLRPVAAAIKSILDIHPQRRFPVLPRRTFFQWAQARGLRRKPETTDNHRDKIAYFTGCSAAYLFPDVGKAAVTILESMGLHVYVPSQGCCGMPLILEGDRAAALKKARIMVESLISLMDSGYQMVTSCPTCGYFFRKLLLGNAYYSDAFQESSGAAEMTVPFSPGSRLFMPVPRKTYSRIFNDDGYFSSIDPLKRIRIAENLQDLGEYLASHCFTTRVTDAPETAMIYYAPCHQRELGIGQPYHDLLKGLPGTDITMINGAMQCCGMGGHLGYKQSLHAKTLEMGAPLIRRLGQESGRPVITDCLSCRLQFQQVLPVKVFHPLEILGLYC